MSSPQQVSNPQPPLLCLIIRIKLALKSHFSIPKTLEGLLVTFLSLTRISRSRIPVLVPTYNLFF